MRIAHGRINLFELIKVQCILDIKTQKWLSYSDSFFICSHKMIIDKTTCLWEIGLTGPEKKINK